MDILKHYQCYLIKSMEENFSQQYFIGTDADYTRRIILIISHHLARNFLLLKSMKCISLKRALKIERIVDTRQYAQELTESFFLTLRRNSHL